MPKDKLTFLQIGLGSMGRRRIRNLLFHNERNIIGFDISSERRAEAKDKYDIRVIDDLNVLTDQEFDAVVISTPPDRHGEYIRFALQHKKHFFVEVTTSDDGYDDVLAQSDERIVMAPSCTFRYFLPIQMIKKILDEGGPGKILAFQYHMGQYLPDWHPWEDYRKVYFAQKETGACREMLPFELIWLNWLIGSRVEDVSGYAAKISDLEMSADDLIIGNLKYENKVMGNIMIDVIARKPFRTLRVLCAEGVLEWEWLDNIIKIYDARSKSSRTVEVPKGNPETGYLGAEEMYNNEMKAFLDAVYARAPYPYSFEEDRRNLRTLYRLEGG